MSPPLPEYAPPKGGARAIRAILGFIGRLLWLTMKLIALAFIFFAVLIIAIVR